MIGMIIKLQGENAWPELQGKEIIHLANDSPPIQIATLEDGMVSGRPSVAIRIDLPNGQYVIAETTARLFVSAGKAIETRYPNLFKDDA